MSAFIAWFASTTIGRWIIGIGAVILAALGLGAFAFLKGKEHQADADKAKDAQERADAARMAQQVQTDAVKAAAQAQQDAAKQPPPNPDKRDDLDTTF